MSTDERRVESPPADKLVQQIEDLTKRGRELEASNHSLTGSVQSLKGKLTDATRLLRISTSGLISLDKSGLIDGVNPRAVDLLGADQTYLLKKPISLFIAPEDQSVFYINRSRAFAGDLKDPFEISLRKRDGSTWSARVHAHPVETPNQRLPGMLLAVEDITAYRQALEALQFKEYFANLVFSIMDDLAVWSTADMDEIITYSLEKMGLVTGADRVYVCLFHERKTRLSITHEWLGDDIKSPAQALDGAPLATFSHMVNQLKKRTTVAVADIQHLESAERGAYEAFHAPGVKAFLFSPLFYGRFLLGIIGCDAVQKPMAWTAETKNLVKCMGTAIVNALVRRQVEQTPTDIRQSLLQFVKAESDIVIDEPYEYEGPIEIIDNVTDTATKEAQWQIEAGAPESSEELGTALLKDGKTANIACRNCNRQKLIERSEIRTLGTRLKVTCICGNAMYIKIELRREHRKKVNLEGVFMRGPGDRIALKSDDWGNILITNLSRHGVGFNLFDKQDFRLNDRFRVKFALDNTARSVIQKAVVVRSVAGKAIGCEFAGKDPCDVTLGFYMMT